MVCSTSLMWKFSHVYMCVSHKKLLAVNEDLLQSHFSTAWRRHALSCIRT